MPSASFLSEQRLAPGHDGAQLARLRSERDAAIRAEHTALFDITRLTRLLTVLSEPATIEGLLNRTVATVSELFRADVVALLTPARDDSCTILAAIGLPEVDLLEPMAAPLSSPLARALSGGEPVTSIGLASDATIDVRLRDVGVESAIWVPMHDAEGGVLGVLLLGVCVAEPFTLDDVSLLVSMAHRISLAVEQAQRSLQLERLADATQMIGRHLDERAILREAARILPGVLHADAVSLVVMDPDGSVRAYEQSAETRVGIDAWTRLLGAPRVRQTLRDGQIFQTSDVLLAGDPGDGIPSNVRALIIPVVWDGAVQGAVCGYRTVSRTWAAETVQLGNLYARQLAGALENARLYRAVTASDDRFRALIRGVTDVILILAADGTIRYASPAAQAVWGIDAGGSQGTNVLTRVHPDDLDRAREILASVSRQPDATLTGGLRLKHLSQGWRDFEVILSNLVADPAVEGIVATYRDVTERKAFEQQLSQLAFSDPLSGLPNRARFMDRVDTAMARARRGASQVAVLFIDLNDFKVINDSLGHAAGDEVLSQVANRLRSCVRGNDTAARLGGDEFTVLLEGITDASEAVVVAERIVRALEEPVRVVGRDVIAAASIGIALSTTDHDQPDDLMRRADSAMYRAKSGGKSGYAVFEANLEGIGAS